eukprot:RCo034325
MGHEVLYPLGVVLLLRERAAGRSLEGVLHPHDEVAVWDQTRGPSRGLRQHLGDLPGTTEGLVDVPVPHHAAQELTRLDKHHNLPDGPDLGVVKLPHHGLARVAGQEALNGALLRAHGDPVHCHQEVKEGHNPCRPHRAIRATDLSDMPSKGHGVSHPGRGGRVSLVLLGVPAFTLVLGLAVIVFLLFLLGLALDVVLGIVLTAIVALRFSVGKGSAPGGALPVGHVNRREVFVGHRGNPRAATHGALQDVACGLGGRRLRSALLPPRTVSMRKSCGSSRGLGLGRSLRRRLRSSRLPRGNLLIRRQTRCGPAVAALEGPLQQLGV